MSEAPSRKERKQFLPSKLVHQRKGFETKTAANFLIIKEIISTLLRPNKTPWLLPIDLFFKTMVSFSSCQQNLIKTFQIEAMIALITKMAMIFS